MRRAPFQGGFRSHNRHIGLAAAWGERLQCDTPLFRKCHIDMKRHIENSIWCRMQFLIPATFII